MHHKEEKTTLAYLRQTLSYTHYPLDSPLINDKEKNFYFKQPTHIFISSKRVVASSPQNKTSNVAS